MVGDQGVLWRTDNRKIWWQRQQPTRRNKVLHAGLWATHCEVGFWAKYFILARGFLASSPWSCVFHEYNSNQYFRFAHIKMGGAQICTLFNQTVTEKNWQQTTMINIWNCKAPKMCAVYKTSVLTLWYTVGWGTAFQFFVPKKTILDHFQTH